ncbi:MAG: glycosyltransferase [Betaproteobacteria bacterium]|jgi:glycosyltransferase involved in cell wall biosynthesis|nr:glycosyltransferase [Betaproteobacteria bacterium]
MNNDELNSPLVSIVVPSYNHGRYLKEAIDSILDQDYPRVELIVIDDGSTDDSPQILASHPGRFHREYQTNQGQVATLNRGWQMSKGDIIGYLSADDVLLPHSVSAAVQCLADNPDAVLSYSDFNLLDPDSGVVRRVNTPECSYRDMAVRMLCPPGPGAFFRRSAFEKAGLWHTGYKQLLDFEYWLRLGLHGRFVRIPQVLAGYRVHPGSQTFASSSNIRPDEPVQIMKDYFDNPLVPEDVRAAKDEAISHALIHSGYTHLRIGNFGLGFAALASAFRMCPRNLLSFRLLRMLFNALFNTTGHRALWWIRRKLRRQQVDV